MFRPAWQRGQEDTTSDFGLGSPMHVSRHESDLVPSSEKWRFRHLFSKSLRVLHFLSAGGTAGEEDHCGCALT